MKNNTPQKYLANGHTEAFGNHQVDQKYFPQLEYHWNYKCIELSTICTINSSTPEISKKLLQDSKVDSYCIIPNYFLIFLSRFLNLSKELSAMTADHTIVEEKASPYTKLKLLVTNKIAMIETINGKWGTRMV